MGWRELFQADCEAMRREGLDRKVFPEGTTVNRIEGPCSRCGAAGSVYSGKFLVWDDTLRTRSASYIGDPCQPGRAFYCTACRETKGMENHRDYPWRENEYLPILRRRLLADPACDAPTEARCPECGHELRVHEATWDSSVDRWEDHRWTVCINPVCAWPGEHGYSSGSYLFG